LSSEACPRPDEPAPAEPPKSASPAPEAPSVCHGLQANRATAFLAVAVLYVVLLGFLTVDEVFDLGWYPTKLERQVNAQIADLGSPEESRRRAAKETLAKSEAFVVVPALIRTLGSPDDRTRGEAADLLRSLTTEHLSGDLMGFRPDEPEGDRRAAQDRLRSWWERVKDDF